MDQSSASSMSLLRASSTFKLEKDRSVLLIGGVTYTTFVPLTVPIKITEIHVVITRAQQLLR